MPDPTPCTPLVEDIGHPVHIVLHIGTTKTGSTSFQNYMDRHRAHLAASGILFPTSGFLRRDRHDLQRTPGHRELFNRITHGDVEGFVEECRTFYTDCADPASARIILSSEEFFHDKPDALARFITPKSGFLNGVTFSVLAVVRNPHEWLRARYQERVTGGWAVESRSFDAFVNDCLVSRMTDYPHWLDNFRILLPEADITVLPYDRLAAAGSLIETMHDAIGQPRGMYTPDITIRSNISAKIGLGLEAIRRVTIFSSCLDRDLRQLWRRNLLERFATEITAEESVQAPRLRQETRARLTDHATMMNGLLAAAYVEGGIDIHQPESWIYDTWSKKEEQRIDALSDLALVELQHIIASFPDRLQPPSISLPLSIEDCRTALTTRRGFSESRTIIIDADIAAAVAASTLGGRIIFFRGDQTLQIQRLLSIVDEMDMPSAIVDATLLSEAEFAVVKGVST